MRRAWRRVCAPTTSCPLYLIAYLYNSSRLRLTSTTFATANSVSSYRTAIMLCRQDGSSVEQLVEYLTDFALTLVHIPTSVTPNSMLRVSEAREAYELAIEVMPQRASLFYEVRPIYETCS